MTVACPACTAAPAAAALAEPPPSVLLSVPGIKCAACIAAIEDGLTQLPGVQHARVNLTQRRVSIVTGETSAQMVSALAGLGYEAHPLDSAALGEGSDPAGRDLLLRLGVAGFAMMNVMLLSVAVWSGAGGATRDLFHLISSAIALPTIFYSGQPFFRSAFGALRTGRLNMDVPISLAIVLAGVMSLYEALNGGHHAYFDAALSLTFFLLIGRYLEHRTRAAARSAAKELTALEVHTAQRKTGTGTQTVRTEDLVRGDEVMVPTGVRCPADGTLISAEAVTDRSFLTGESDPVSVTTGAALSAGEVNLGAPFELSVTAAGADTRLRQIASLVETAENARNSFTSLADRAARIYAPAVHLLALVTFVGWLAATGDFRHALNVSIAVLIITCPCALGLAVPAVSTAAISRLYRLGFLVKSGTALERLAETEVVVFDKTGTLTQPGFDFDLSDLTEEERRVAKALASATAHPISRALDSYLGATEPAPLDAVEEHKGCGVRGRVGTQPVALGRASWLGQPGEQLMLQVGQTLRPLAAGEKTVPGATDLAPALARLGLRAELMSGDSETKTEAVARQLGLPEWSARVSPEEKRRRIKELRTMGPLPCMVGDGLNDTAALAEAHASVAPGSALDAARSSADVVMTGAVLGLLPKLFETARMAVRLSRQNFAIALCYNAIAIPIAVAGLATPLLAALAMSTSSITVLANAMRLTWSRP